MPRPEDAARVKIDAALSAAGWVLQDRDAMNIDAARGVAVRHFPLKRGHGEDESLEASENLPDPDVIAAEIVEDLRAALEQFEAVEGDLRGRAAL